jgi:hypothetical protein
MSAESDAYRRALVGLTGDAAVAADALARVSMARPAQSAADAARSGPAMLAAVRLDLADRGHDWSAVRVANAILVALPALLRASKAAAAVRARMS